MLSVELAEQLRLAGLLWSPASGDRFVVPGRGIDDEVFVISSMTVDVLELPRGRVIGFNGTTEWALDSVHLPDALWLPHEAQLRELLGEQFAGLSADPPTAGPSPDSGAYQVGLRDGRAFRDADAECAYAAALLAVLTG